MLGTPGVVLMAPEEMNTHVTVFIEMTKGNFDARGAFYRVWRSFGAHILERTQSPNWRYFLENKDNDHLLFWARVVGKNVRRYQNKGSPHDAMAIQLLAILLRAKTLNDPISVVVVQLLDPIIEMAGIGEPFTLE